LPKTIKALTRLENVEETVEEKGRGGGRKMI